ASRWARVAEGRSPRSCAGSGNGVQSPTLIGIRLDARTMAGAPTISEVKRERRLMSILALPSVLPGWHPFQTSAPMCCWRLMNVTARHYLQGCGQFSVGRQPVYVPTWPLGPLPPSERTNEPSARTHVLQPRLRARGIEQGFRATGAVLVEIGQPIKNVRHRHHSYGRQ